MAGLTVAVGAPCLWAHPQTLVSIVMLFMQVWRRSNFKGFSGQRSLTRKGFTFGFWCGWV